MSKFTAHLPRRMIEGGVCIDGDCALISMRDPGSPLPQYKNTYVEILQLAFHDLIEGIDDIIPRLIGVSDEEKAEIRRTYISPAQEHAKAVADFIRRHRDRSIIAHCEAGVSRSAAICEVLVNNGWRYVKVYHDRAHYNRLLARLIQEEFDKLPIFGHNDSST